MENQPIINKSSGNGQGQKFKYPYSPEDYQRDLALVQALGYPVLRIMPSAFPGAVHHYYINRCEECQREFDAGVIASKRYCEWCAGWPVSGDSEDEEVLEAIGPVKSEEVER